jgi:hypothetical protein
MHGRPTLNPARPVRPATTVMYRVVDSGAGRVRIARTLFRMPQPFQRRDDRPPAGWTAGVLFDALGPAVIGIAILVFLAAVFIASSANSAGL